MLVDAADEAATKNSGQIKLQELFGTAVPIEIRTVRPATADEIDFWSWHLEKVAAEAK